MSPYKQNHPFEILKICICYQWQKVFLLTTLSVVTRTLLDLGTHAGIPVLKYADFVAMLSSQGKAIN